MSKPDIHYLQKFTSRKVKAPTDSLTAWIDSYLLLAVNGVRSEEVTKKIILHLFRFRDFFRECYGHERISTCLKRDVVNWQNHLQEGVLATSTINNHLASVSAFTTWVTAQDQNLFPAGDPAKGIGELPLPPLEPRALSHTQIRSLKSICDRLPRFHQLKGRQWNDLVKVPQHKAARPWRDRAIVFLLLSTGLRRSELVNLNLEQLEPIESERLREVRKARLVKVVGKRKTSRTVFLSHDARLALADYLEFERPIDASNEGGVLFHSAKSIAARRKDGRLSPRSINLILERIGRWHDSEVTEKERKISPLRPHDLRHTFAFQLSASTGADAYELERRLGHHSQRYIQRYTNPPENLAALYIEKF